MEINKVEVDLSQACGLLSPRLTVIVSCVDRTGKTNVMTVVWFTCVSAEPPMCIVSIRPNRYSHQLIQESKEFVINIPTMDIVKNTLFCGRRTGREHDKFKETSLTPIPAKMVRPPLIKECVAHLECKLRQQMTVGDHTLFIGEILAAYANEKIFDGKFNLQKVKMLYHVGKDDFVTLASEIITPKLTK